MQLYNDCIHIASQTWCVIGTTWMSLCLFNSSVRLHGDVITWKRFQHYWRFVRGIHQSAVSSQKVSVTESFTILFASLDKLGNKQSSCWWFKMPCTHVVSLWRYFSVHDVLSQWDGEPVINKYSTCCLHLRSNLAWLMALLQYVRYSI